MDNVNTYKVNKEAVKKIAEKVYDNGSTVINRNDLEELFPELKEGEDERIRKVLIGWINLEPSTSFNDTFDGFSKEQILVWLEKQGKQKPVEVRTTGYWNVQDIEQKPADKVEPSAQNKPIHSVGEAQEWLQSLHTRVQPKQEWNEEDEEMFDGLTSIVEDWHDAMSEEEKEYYGDCGYTNWLKSLKERYTWKPSGEHYELEEFAKIIRGNLTCISKAVQELFEAKYLQLTGNKMYGGFKD